MDLVDTYSNSTPGTTPANSLPPSPGAPPLSAAQAVATLLPPRTTPPIAPVPAPQPAQTKLVTGTVENIAFSEQDFGKLERALDTTGSSVDPHTGVVIRPRLPRKPSAILPSAPAQTASASARIDASVRVNAPERPAPNPAPRKRPRTAKAPPFVPTSRLHVSATHDYQNRTWMDPPSAARTFAQLETYTPYIPKRCIFQKHIHDNGVSLARFFPSYGHLLLTAGMDGKAHVWNVDHSLRCVRSYHAHSKAVRDATFMHDGSAFLTAGYDRALRLWDTETGRVIGNYNTPAIPYCTRFSPLHNGNEFLVGCGDRKILQIDVRDASAVVQQYDQHMGAVNSISFVDDDRRFVSSADDKVLRLWEYGVPVVIRDVSQPSAHSMPVTRLHPNRKWLACQSMDNTIRIFSARDKFKPNAKKVFKGHLVAGYACGLATSSDGRFLASADSLGRLFFWDWKTTRVFNAIQAHDGVCIDLEWHPTRPSLVVSCGRDGKIKMWD